MDPVRRNIERLGQTLIGVVHCCARGFGRLVDAIGLHLGGAVVVVENIEGGLSGVGAASVFEEGLAGQARLGECREKRANAGGIKWKAGHSMSAVFSKW